ncbi:hypothetical protein C0J52_10128 [Blattella germanica]|nr:hypothetical protein C0J52_10128 [Blattella germanica]
MQGALDSSSGKTRSSHSVASSPPSANVSVLGLLQTVCTNPSAVLNSSVDTNNQFSSSYVSPNLMETVVKQLLQLASSTTANHVTGAGSPLKNGVRTCTCIVHLVLLQELRHRSKTPVATASRDMLERVWDRIAICRELFRSACTVRRFAKAFARTERRKTYKSEVAFLWPAMLSPEPDLQLLYTSVLLTTVFCLSLWLPGQECSIADSPGGTSGDKYQKLISDVRGERQSRNMRNIGTSLGGPGSSLFDIA